MTTKTGTASFIKDPYVKTQFATQQELDDFIKCCDPVTGPMYFLDNFFYIQHPTRGGMVYHPWDYQKRLIDTYHSNRFSISLMPRQSGKSTSAAGYLLWYAMFVPDSTILIAAHKYTGAQEIMQRIRYAYENCPQHIKAGVTTYNKGSLDFENGSRIVSATTTENTGRGMSISLLYLDEFAFVRPGIAELFWTSITPTLATGGKAIITSTPNSDEDQFALIWKGANKTEDEFGNETPLGVNGFKAYRSHYSEQPGRDEVWAKQMRAQLGDDKFRREIGLEFIIADETLINPSTLIDLTGIELNKYIAECTGEPNNIYYSLENNTIGEAALISLNEYGESNMPGTFLSEPGKKRKGFNTTQKVKLIACAKFKTLLESKKMTIYSKSLISELKTFVASGGSYAAKIGDHDDLVMGSLLIVRMLQTLSDFHYDLEEQIRDHAEYIAPLPFFAVLR